MHISTLCVFELTIRHTKLLYYLQFIKAIKQKYYKQISC